MTANPPAIPSRLIVTGCDEIVGPWVCAKTDGIWSPGMPSIGLARNNELVAGVVFDQYNGASICMHVASDGSRNWLNREFLWFCFHYPFEQLGVKRVTGLVPENNADARRFDEHLGFQYEATLIDALPSGNVCVYRMLKSECRWLDIRRRK